MKNRAVITQGEHLVSDNRDLVISTLLGSCVACCLWDSDLGVGGMNHMLLTRRGNTLDQFGGVNAMEILINDLLKLGARRTSLEAKAFGGAQMVSGLSEIGPNNSAFILEFLEAEGIVCRGQSLGGTAARQILFTPSSGLVRMKMRTEESIPEIAVPAISQPAGNGMELF